MVLAKPYMYYLNNLVFDLGITSMLLKLFDRDSTKLIFFFFFNFSKICHNVISYSI